VIGGSLTRILPTEKFLPTSRRLTVPEWIVRAQIMLRGKHYNLAGHEYLHDIIHDHSPDQVFEKAAQVGISTVVLIKSLYVAEHLGKKAIYFFQDDAAVSDFSNDRALSMLQESPYLKNRVRDINNVGLKKIGPGSLYFRGLFTKGKAKSVDGDMVVLDEVSEMKEEHRALALDRVMHSNLQWVFALSQPNLPGDGIDAEFATTDQHYWHIMCPSCGHDNCLEHEFLETFRPIPSKLASGFPEGATHYRGCSKCEAKLNMKAGKWIAHQPTKRRRGYHLSQLYTQIRPAGFPNYATKVMTEYEESRRSQAKMARFVISILGFPYGGGAARVHDELLNACEGSYGFTHAGTGAYMGVDQGDVLTIAIGIRSGVRFKFLYFEETESWNRLDELMTRFGVEYCIIDAQPNKWNAKEFAAKHPRRVSIQYFGNTELRQAVELHESKWEINSVYVDRTESIDGFIDKMEIGLIEFPARAQTDSGLHLSRLEDMRRHLKKLIVKYEPRANGLMVRTYIRGPNIENHYGMACNSASIAAFEFGREPGPMCMPVFRQVANA